VSKRLIICCDGTWNTPDQADGGRPAPTNVAKVALSIAPSGKANVEQRVYYQHGVGVRRWEHIRGGVFGFGLSRNVREAYRFIVENYEPGDELFFFGFSRGAFTARSVIGLIRNAGVLRRENVPRIDEAYALYRDRSAHPNDMASQLFRRSHSFEPRIRFVGVWDTVGALGIPLSGVPGCKTITRRWAFHDTALSSIVDAAYQALAIDEQRKPFEPAIWEPQIDSGRQTIEQVWFSGVHGDIGGGHADSGLSDIALTWMVDRATTNGLEFTPGAITPAPGPIVLSSISNARVDPQPLADLHESHTKFYRLLRPAVRGIGQTDPGHEYAGSTAVERRDATEYKYAPSGLVDYLNTNDAQIIDVLPPAPREEASQAA
jgi:uncharacterized protein (DUF2235 family)